VIMDNKSQRKNSNNNQNRRQTTHVRNQYVTGSAAREYRIQHAIEEKPIKKLSHSTRKNRDKAIYMNASYVLFLAVALSIAGIILIGYIGVQSDISEAMRSVSKYEIELNKIKSDNDEELSRINSEINLEEIKEIAINELGMVYAKEGQVIGFTSENNDYVRQFRELPE